MNNVELKLTLEFSDDVPEGDVHYIMDRVVDALTDRVNNLGLVGENANYFTKQIRISNNTISEIIQNF
jgi:hypothetical protein